LLVASGCDEGIRLQGNRRRQPPGGAV